ncbi:MAG: hypothetical protein AAF211_20410 [Myxococcota bacterium]
MSADRPERHDRKYRRFLRARAPMGRRVPPIWADMLCAYLDAEPRAVWVLSDLLTEAGAEPLRPGSDAKRVRRVLGVLPPPLAHDIACDFAEHVLRMEGRQSPRADALWAIDRKRHWLRGEIDDRTLQKAKSECGLSTVPLMEFVLSTSPSPSIPPGVAKHALEWGGLWEARERAGFFRSRLGSATQRSTELRWQRRRLEERLQAEVHSR